jgi:hypothetical protein
LKTGKPVVLVLFTGRSISIGTGKQKLFSCTDTWFAEIEAGKLLGCFV